MASLGAGETVWRVRVLVAQPDDLSLWTPAPTRHEKTQPFLMPSSHRHVRTVAHAVKKVFLK